MPASHQGVPCVCVSAPLPGAQRALRGACGAQSQVWPCSWGRLGTARADGEAGRHVRLCSGAYVVRPAPPRPRLPPPRPPPAPAPPPSWWRPTAPPNVVAASLWIAIPCGA